MASTDSISFPLRWRSVSISRRVGKESTPTREMLFPVTNSDLVSAGKECGIASNSWFWHFTVCEKHKHLSGQPWQDSTAARRKRRRKRKCIVPRMPPHDVLNRRILGGPPAKKQTREPDAECRIGRKKTFVRLLVPEQKQPPCLPDVPWITSHDHSTIMAF
ncbi:hypothetical protein EYF80_029186 [Liparis tanakae]|uniref:Uncharacterized protein n=1 Tax=Liparis tanakae TaxID=230148 RepID=A0A4Z2H5S0_9TELE|nr:hypothetical protein EYF80_029186 [Liparis tanakae]